MHTLSGLLIHRMATAPSSQCSDACRIRKDGETEPGWLLRQRAAQAPPFRGPCAADSETRCFQLLRTGRAQGTDSCLSKPTRG